MIGYSLGAMPMLMLGGFQFGVNTAAYQELTRRTEYRWAQQDLYGRRPALQHTGEGMDTITLSGTIYTAWRGGTGQLDQLRRLAATGRPQRLISGLGRLMGQWIIEGIEEKQSTFAAFGITRKQEFSMTLKRFS